MSEDNLDAQIQRVQRAMQATDIDIERLSYWLGAAQDIRRGFTSIDAAIHAPEANMSNPPSVLAAYLRRAVVKPTSELLAHVETTELRDARLTAIHHEGVTALRLAVEAFSVLAEAFERSDAALQAKARQLREQEVPHRTIWLTGVTQLGRELDIND